MGGVREGLNKPDGVAYKYCVRKESLDRKIRGENEGDA